MHASLSVLCVSVHLNSKLEQASFICCFDFVFLLLSLFVFVSFVLGFNFYLQCLFTRQKYIYSQHLFIILKEFKITDAGVFQTACIAQDDFFTWHHLRRVFAKLVLAEISNIEFAKTRTDFFLSYLQFSVKMNLLLVPVLVFGSVIQKIFLEKIILKKNTPP